MKNAIIIGAVFVTGWQAHKYSVKLGRYLAEDEELRYVFTNKISKKITKVIYGERGENYRPRPYRQSRVAYHFPNRKEA